MEWQDGIRKCNNRETPNESNWGARRQFIQVYLKFTWLWNEAGRGRNCWPFPKSFRRWQYTAVWIITVHLIKHVESIWWILGLQYSNVYFATRALHVHIRPSYRSAKSNRILHVSADEKIEKSWAGNLVDGKRAVGDVCTWVQRWWPISRRRASSSVQYCKFWKHYTVFWEIGVNLENGSSLVPVTVCVYTSVYTYTKWNVQNSYQNFKLFTFLLPLLLMLAQRAVRRDSLLVTIIVPWLLSFSPAFTGSKRRHENLDASEIPHSTCHKPKSFAPPTTKVVPYPINKPSPFN